MKEIFLGEFIRRHGLAFHLTVEEDCSHLWFRSAQQKCYWLLSPAYGISVLGLWRTA